MEILFQIIPYLVCICIPAVRLLMQSMQLLTHTPSVKRITVIPVLRNL